MKTSYLVFFVVVFFAGFFVVMVSWEVFQKGCMRKDLEILDKEDIF